ncbi:MAG: DNA methyltransferase [Candidatus Raymondbacteria bacterium RifOxyC12_full_50_8]|uniref:site-specific DNA-methyltransferase (adenine-specific) n=1 Tax=Candidatus Raymondbacteria bacterium RIFOXYD12_FULL_49_13 TaxID=1817890 RepID=A0A1F7FGZ7_UNCRA|nr:MAG: DNA methyltransferase [Candidatus Raymondbacteria bacterium RIFOXYA2_FULL_49_16]OGJ94512.1 MAG: DNA methyltransferase [Candidatus Raymondbacteria bacterium RifOxyC12_full_50_8]OGJ99276.1 MAG: DNA methyltransferase [Candidatus Raymondbacteria bacterium RifOxyB12_full_50_8]OGK05868.1 MAG: DNA methyltransferase [Candidatus Raymondbacteria bacterium RIFOXYD12_FULL_49_13]OGP43362.1 MAG: DNA methyltransferase [Candidatus Raymondbacteria bacterium RIFOXYB2_FULL_49_35]
MLTSKPEIKAKIDKLWNLFWSGGMANPLATIEQISYLIFIKRIEDMDVHEKKAAERRDQKYTSIFKGNEKCRWSHWMHFDAESMLKHVRDEVFPFIKEMRGENNFYAESMKDAVFLIPKASLILEAVKIIDELNLSSQGADIQGDIYEYLLSEIAQSGTNGQFRTPRHIIRMMVELIDPKLGEKVCDPAAGTAGFLIGAYTHILKMYSDPENIEYDEDGTPHHLTADKIVDKRQWQFLREKAFTGYDFDTTMVRIALMNMVLHGITNPNIRYSDTLSKRFEERNHFDVILANPPFKGNVDKSDIADDLRMVGSSKTPKTELLFLNLFVNMLIPGGRCGVIVPDGVLFGSSNMHVDTRKLIMDTCALEGIISMPSGVFKPYAGVSTAVMIFTKGEKTDKVWFYDMQADGYSLDDKRAKIDQNDLPDIIEKWKARNKKKQPKKGDRWLWVDAEEIRKNNCDLSISRYKAVEYEEVKYEKPEKIIEKLLSLENDIFDALRTLKKMCP